MIDCITPEERNFVNSAIDSAKRNIRSAHETRHEARKGKVIYHGVAPGELEATKSRLMKGETHVIGVHRREIAFFERIKALPTCPTTKRGSR